MSEIKLVFTGSMGSGKTTAISALSEIPVISTDVQIADVAENTEKTSTTVAMDYGELTLEDSQKLRLYGTPGQERFSYMWKILTEGALGLIILIDNAGDDPLGDLKMYLENFHDFIQETSAVIGITRTDVATQPGLDEYYKILTEKDMLLPMMTVDARSYPEVVGLVRALMAMLEFQTVQETT